MKKSYDHNSKKAVYGILTMLIIIYYLFYNPDIYQQYQISFFPINERFMNLLARVFETSYLILSCYICLDICETYVHKNIKELAMVCVKIYLYFLIIYFLIFFARLLLRGPSVFDIYGITMYTPVYMLFDILGIANLLGTPTLSSSWWIMGVMIGYTFYCPLINQSLINKKYSLPALFIVFSLCICFIYPLVATYLLLPIILISLSKQNNKVLALNKNKLAELFVLSIIMLVLIALWLKEKTLFVLWNILIAIIGHYMLKLIIYLLPNQLLEILAKAGNDCFIVILVCETILNQVLCAYVFSFKYEFFVIFIAIVVTYICVYFISMFVHKISDIVYRRKGSYDEKNKF